MNEEVIRLLRFILGCSILGELASIIGLVWVQDTHARGWTATPLMITCILILAILGVACGAILWRAGQR